MKRQRDIVKPFLPRTFSGIDAGAQPALETGELQGLASFAPAGAAATGRSPAFVKVSNLAQ